MPLTPRERVLATINHEVPDRIPIVMGVSNATGIKMKPYRELKQLIGVEADDNYIYQWPELGTAEIDEETMKRLRVDVRGVLDVEASETLEYNRTRDPHSPYISSWGTGQKEIEPGVWFPGVHPLAKATTIEAIENYPWPDMSDPTRVAHVKTQAQQLADENQYAIMATPWLLFPLERAFGIQGMDNFLTNLALYPDFAKALLKNNAELCKTMMGSFLHEIGDNIDIIKIGDDLGTQVRKTVKTHTLNGRCRTVSGGEKTGEGIVL
jgi:uroporphyrinogen decarboxylase